MSDLRMPTINRVELAGRLTRDPELRYIPTGAAVCTFGLAVSKFTKTHDGERREEVMFINVEVWEKTAEFVSQYIKKGNPVIVDGELRQREWEDKNTGQKRSVHEVRANRVQRLDWDERDGQRDTQAAPARSERAAKPADDEPIPEDDLPF
jgi:single-strand DNA-binding protein